MNIYLALLLGTLIDIMAYALGGVYGLVGLCLSIFFICFILDSVWATQRKERIPFLGSLLLASPIIGHAVLLLIIFDKNARNDLI